MEPANNKSSPPDFTTEAQDNPESLATQATSSGQGTTELLERAEQINKVLYSISNAVNTTLNLDDLYRAIHESLGNIIDATNFFITTVDNKTKTLHFPYYVDSRDTGPPPIIDFNTENTLTGLVVHRRQPIMFRQKELEERGSRNGIVGSTPLVWLGVPLIIKDEIIGIIAVQSYTDPNLFSEKDLHLLTAISDQIAIAIDRKRSVDQLKKSELRFRQLFEQSNDAIIVYNLHGKILDCNNRACTLLDHPKSRLVQMTVEDLYSQDETKMDCSGDRQPIPPDHSFFETTIKKADRNRLDVEISTRIIDRKNEGMVQAIIRDITERKQTEKKLIDSEKKYRTLFNNAQVGLFRIHYTPQPVIECNSALATMFGHDNDTSCLENFPLMQVESVSGEHIDLLDLVRKKRKITNLKFSRKLNNGRIGWFRFSADYNAEQNQIEGSISDVTEATVANREKLQLQEELERSRKMEALGLLVGGVAHDLNNILAGIAGYPELILLKYPGDSRLKKSLEAIQDSGRRAAEIVGDLLTLARSAASVKESHDLHTLIHEYLDSPEHKHLKCLHPQVEIKTNLTATASTISCSPIHVKKCLMNLVTNGAEAIIGKGSITLSTTNVTTTDLHHNDRPTQEHVILDIKDTGIGISDADTKHIFEPFYTRKKMGRSGTGLGLTVVWNTMQDHRGKVTINSSDQGTSFKLFFPVDSGPSEDILDIPQHIIGGHGESILVVDDEILLRDLACQFLTTIGYSPQAVASGEQALDFLTKNQVDLILLDMQMEPGMNGHQTYREIIKTNPGQKAIIASGFSESDDVKAALALGVGGYIKKPYTISQLSHIVAKELAKK